MESEGEDDLVEEPKELHLTYFTKIEEAYDECLTPWLPHYDAAACINPQCKRNLDNDAFLAMKDLFPAVWWGLRPAQGAGAPARDHHQRARCVNVWCR